MTDRASLEQKKPQSLGTETLIALAFTIFWLVACAMYIVFDVPSMMATESSGILTLVMELMASFFPLIMVWIAAYLSKSIRSVRAEASVLRKSMNQIKTFLLEKPQNSNTALAEQLAKIMALAKQTEQRLNELAEKQIGMPVAARTNSAALAEKIPKSQDPSQATLPLHTSMEPERMPITVVEFIRALNFPENANDKEGFRILRRAFEERELGKLLQASQDVLTLLSQDGIYMDDLNPDKPLPKIWRRFASGQRGLPISALGSLPDQSALTLARTRLKNDPVFRDAAHHFLRKFDQILVEFEPMAEDYELLEMSMTRTARAFMLLGHVAGSFD
jgi:hypothetical protein